MTLIKRYTNWNLSTEVLDWVGGSGGSEVNRRGGRGEERKMETNSA
jgi:hypothetical protein